MQSQVRPTNLKLHEFPDQSFIHGVYIPEYICDNLINYFENNPQKHEAGKINEAMDGKTDETVNNKEVKKSTDIGFHPYTIEEDARDLSEYLQYLNLAVREYEHRYERVRKLSQYGVKGGCNIQKYKPGEGFYDWHDERNAILTQDRCLVWMTYLNDVPDGGTEFMYQKITSPAKKGLTLIWPSDWTHTHRGQVSNTHTKYIITGWFNYLQ